MVKSGALTDFSDALADVSMEDVRQCLARWDDDVAVAIHDDDYTDGEGILFAFED